jgi:Predicted membrane protein (DUF2306)
VTTIAASERLTPSVTSRRIVKIAGWSVMALLALLVFLYAARYLTLNPLVYLENHRDVYVANVIPLTMHIAGAMVALLIGPFQFLPKIITWRYLNVHRWLGRIYFWGFWWADSVGCTWRF